MFRFTTLVRGVGSYQERLAEKNWDTTYAVLVRRGPRTFSELVEDTKLSTRTVAKLLSKMVRGRPPSVVKFKGYRVDGKVLAKGDLSPRIAYSLTLANKPVVWHNRMARDVREFDRTRWKESTKRFRQRARYGEPVAPDVLEYGKKPENEYGIEKRPRLQAYFAAAAFWPYMRWEVKQK